MIKFIRSQTKISLPWAILYRLYITSIMGNTQVNWHTPKLLMDSTTSPKVMTTEWEGVGARSLARNTSGVKGCVGTLRWRLRRLTSKSITHTDLHKLNNKLVSALLEHFGAQTNHAQTQTHKTHHGPDLGEATTFPFIVYFVLGHMTCTQMSFCFETPKWELRNFQNWDSHKLFVQTSDWGEVWSKVLALVESFPMVCGMSPSR
jgi:hypothetical protein